jgi:hypothetical protein
MLLIIASVQNQFSQRFLSDAVVGFTGLLAGVI